MKGFKLEGTPKRLRRTPKDFRGNKKRGIRIALSDKVTKINRDPSLIADKYLNSYAKTHGMFTSDMHPH